MTADRLARHYPALRPDERLALMLAAAARGDDTDHARLVAAAPRAAFTALDTFPRAIAFREVLDRFRAERLDLAARYFHARSLAAGAARRVRSRFDGVARVHGYLLLAYRDAWARFCEGAVLRPGGLDEHLVGGEVLAAAEGAAEADATTGAAVKGFFRRAGGGRPRAAADGRVGGGRVGGDVCHPADVVGGGGTMRVRGRVDRLRRAVGGLPPPGQLDLVVAVPVGSGMADDLPTGIHFNADGRVATVVFDGTEPDPSVIAELSARLAPSGLAISAPGFEVVPLRVRGRA